MNLDLYAFKKTLRKDAQKFEIKPWMVLTVVVVMLALLALGLAAWIIPPAAEQVAEIVSTVTPTAAPTVIPTRTPQPSPTPMPSLTPIPQVYIVWTEKVNVYLLSEPGAGIIASIPNGERVELLTPTAQTVGGITWRPVRYQMVDGWLAQGEVYQIEAGYLQIGEPGTSVFRDPAGSVDRWLSPGTPYHALEIVEEAQWQPIRLPDGQEGWLNRYAEAVP
jgi:hypothetical protein